MGQKGVKVGRWDKGSKSGTVPPKLGRLTGMQYEEAFPVYTRKALSIVCSYGRGYVMLLKIKACMCKHLPAVLVITAFTDSLMWSCCVCSSGIASGETVPMENNS